MRSASASRTCSATTYATTLWTLRRREHFRQIIGRHATLKTGAEIAGRRNFKGEIKDAGERAVTVGVDGNDVDIPYEAIVRGNLIDEG